MSDERDGADAAGDGDDADVGGQTAVVTRPQRPTGKRARQRSGDVDPDEAGDVEETAVELGVDDDDTKAKKAKKAKKAQVKKAKKGAESSRNPFAYIWNFLKQVVAELRKVIWPNRKELVNYVSVMLVFLAFMVALISFADLGLHKLVLWALG